MKPSVKMANNLGNHAAWRQGGRNSGGAVWCTDNMSDFAFGTPTSNNNAGAKTGTGFFTIEFWFRSSIQDTSSPATSYNFDNFFGFGMGDYVATGSTGRVGWYLDRNRPSVQTIGLTGNPYMNPDASNGTNNNGRCFLANTWYHCAIVCDGSTSHYIRLYINGYFYNFLGNGTVPSGLTWGQPSSVQIGCQGSGWNSGQLDWDDFRVYKGVALYGVYTDASASPTGSATGTYIGTSASVTGGALASGYTLPVRGAPLKSTYESYCVLDVGFDNQLVDRTGRHQLSRRPIVLNGTYDSNAQTVSYTGSSATGNTITVSSTANMFGYDAIKFSTSFGGITAGTIYYINTIPSATTITISATFAGTVKTMTTASSSGTATFADYVNSMTITGSSGSTLTVTGTWNNPWSGGPCYIAGTVGSITEGWYYLTSAPTGSSSFSVATLTGGTALTAGTTSALSVPVYYGPGVGQYANNRNQFISET